MIVLFIYNPHTLEWDLDKDQCGEDQDLVVDVGGDVVDADFGFNF